MNPAVVIETGTNFSKIGIAGQETPKYVHHSHVEKKPKSIMIGMGKEVYVGKHPKPAPKVEKVVERGVITNFQSAERLWSSFYEEIKVKSNSQPLLYVFTPIFLEKSYLENITRIMFESFNVPLFSMSNEAELCLNVAGRSTGIVLSSGSGITYAAAVYERNLIEKSIMKTNLAGADLDALIASHLNSIGYSFNTRAELEIIKDIKITLCHSTTYSQKENSQNYEMPDGTIISVPSEVLQLPNALFDPKFYGIESMGATELCFECIQKCEKSIQKELFSNIILNGGTTCFKGFSEKLTFELSKLTKEKIEVISAPSKKYFSWIGGSLFANETKSWISKEEYDEKGPEIIHNFLKDSSIFEK